MCAEVSRGVIAPKGYGIGYVLQCGDLPQVRHIDVFVGDFPADYIGSSDLGGVRSWRVPGGLSSLRGSPCLAGSAGVAGLRDGSRGHDGLGGLHSQASGTFTSLAHRLECRLDPLCNDGLVNLRRRHLRTFAIADYGARSIRQTPAPALRLPRRQGVISLRRIFARYARQSEQGTRLQSLTLAVPGWLD